VHTIPSALLHFGTVFRTGVLYLSALAWRVGHGPLNQTQCFYGRKTEEKEIRDTEQAKVKFFIQTVLKKRLIMFDSKILHPLDDDLTEVKIQTYAKSISSANSHLVLLTFIAARLQEMQLTKFCRV
jgi:hypothetical protein